ncbi:hypothetical protein ACLKA7_001229 [Drosophila subpalustris]
MVTMPADSAKNATPEMVTMPAGQAESGPRKPVFHPGLGVEGVILPPQITSEPKQSALSAAEASAGAKAVGEAPTAGARKKFSYTERRSAGDILQRHHNNAGSNLSADWLRKVEWAKSVIPDWQQSSRALAQAKRQRSQEAPAPSAKKSRVQAGKSFAQIARERILIGVLDRGNQDGKIPRNQWRWVESALATQCLQLLEKEPGPPPICKDVGWYQGNVKLSSSRVYKSDAAVGDALPDKPVEEDIVAEPTLQWWRGTLQMSLRLLQINLHHCKAASAALLLRLAGDGADIVLIQEPWVVGGKVSGLGSADYKLFVANAQAVSLELRPAPIRLLSSYMSYDQEGPIPEDIARSLVSDCASNKIGLIIGCDANTRESASEGPHSTVRLLNLINIFTDACTSACKASFPVVKSRGRKKPPWWNHNLNELRKRSRTLFNQAKASDINEAWLNYKRQLAVYKKEIRRAKRHSWRGFCSDIESTSEAARLRKILSKSSPSLGYIKNDNDTWTTSSEESLETLLTKHFPGCSQHSLCSRQVLNEVPLNPSLFSPNNIAWAINSFKPFKSPGHDGIAPAHLQHAGNTAINWLQSIFTGIFRTGQIPEPWKNSKVVFIPKAGKASHITAKDFRPISLTSFLLKTFERILSLHLRAIIPCDLISNSQHAYRKDIEDAFNNVFPDAIAEALTDLGIEGQLVGLINQLLTSRAVTSKVGSSKLTRSCRDEEEEESPEHFFCFCPALSSRRFRFLGKPFLDGLGDLASLSPQLDPFLR